MFKYMFKYNNFSVFANVLSCVRTIKFFNNDVMEWLQCDKENSNNADTMHINFTQAEVNEQNDEDVPVSG